MISYSMHCLGAKDRVCYYVSDCYVCGMISIACLAWGTPKSGMILYLRLLCKSSWQVRQLCAHLADVSMRAAAQFCVIAVREYMRNTKDNAHDNNDDDDTCHDHKGHATTCTALATTVTRQPRQRKRQSAQKQPQRHEASAGSKAKTTTSHHSRVQPSRVQSSSASFIGSR